MSQHFRNSGCMCAWATTPTGLTLVAYDYESLATTPTGLTIVAYDYVCLG